MSYPFKLNIRSDCSLACGKKSKMNEAQVEQCPSDFLRVRAAFVLTAQS